MNKKRRKEILIAVSILIGFALVMTLVGSLT